MSSQNEKEAKHGSTKKLHEQLNPEGLLTHPAYEELQQKLEKSEEEKTQHWERILRMQADMDNMQRRVERDVANAHKFALEKFVNELLPVIDSLERSLLIEATPETESMLEGVQLTLKMFTTVLEKFGVQQVNPESEGFNPELHQAVSVQADASAKSGVVLSVLQKGYLLNNRLVRPALVVVSK